MTAKDIPCRYCGAKSGEYCRRKNGQHTLFHTSRRWDAKAKLQQVPVPEPLATQPPATPQTQGRPTTAPRPE